MASNKIVHCLLRYLLSYFMTIFSLCWLSRNCFERPLSFSLISLDRRGNRRKDYCNIIYKSRRERESVSFVSMFISHSFSFCVEQYTRSLCVCYVSKCMRNWDAGIGEWIKPTQYSLWHLHFYSRKKYF